MSHSHDHGAPDHGAQGPGRGGASGTGRHRRRLVVVLALTLAVVVVQVVGGLASGSLALLADAGHALTDSSGLLIAVLASVLAARPATGTRTYGLQRAEVLAALVNALLLVGIAVWVLLQAVDRWNSPEPVRGGLMLGVAVLGAAVNTVGLLVLRGGKDASLNLRGAYLEVLGDLFGSLAVIVASVVIITTGFTRADPLASVLIFVLIVPRAWGLLREVVDVLLEATPKGVDLVQVRRHLRETEGVIDVHDLHAWTITSGMPVLSAHIVVAPEWLAHRSGEVLDRLADCLGDHFDVAHCTFQLEPEGHRQHEFSPHH